MWLLEGKALVTVLLWWPLDAWAHSIGGRVLGFIYSLMRCLRGKKEWEEEPVSWRVEESYHCGRGT